MVDGGAVERAVGLALVPDDSADGERGERRDHAVVERRGLPRWRVGMPGMVRERAPAALRGCILALSPRRSSGEALLRGAEASPARRRRERARGRRRARRC